MKKDRLRFINFSLFYGVIIASIFLFYSITVQENVIQVNVAPVVYNPILIILVILFFMFRPRICNVYVAPAGLILFPFCGFVILSLIQLIFDGIIIYTIGFFQFKDNAVSFSDAFMLMFLFYAIPFFILALIVAKAIIFHNKKKTKMIGNQE